MNDSKNLILAVVLSALVLLGWSWAANKYFPTANPPSTKVENGQQQPLPQPQAQPGAPTGAENASGPLGGARLDPARPDPDAVARRLDQPQGRADRRFDPGPAARDDREEFAAGAAAVAARRAGRLYRLVRLDRPGRRRSRPSTRCGPPTARRSRPAIRSRSTRKCRTAPATRSRSRSMKAICSPSARAL